MEPRAPPVHRKHSGGLWKGDKSTALSAVLQRGQKKYTQATHTVNYIPEKVKQTITYRASKESSQNNWNGCGKRNIYQIKLFL